MSLVNLARHDPTLRRHVHDCPPVYVLVRLPYRRYFFSRLRLIIPPGRHQRSTQGIVPRSLKELQESLGRYEFTLRQGIDQLMYLLTCQVHEIVRAS